MFLFEGHKFAQIIFKREEKIEKKVKKKKKRKKSETVLKFGFKKYCVVGPKPTIPCLLTIPAINAKLNTFTWHTWNLSIS